VEKGGFVNTLLYLPSRTSLYQSSADPMIYFWQFFQFSGKYGKADFLGGLLRFLVKKKSIRIKV